MKVKNYRLQLFGLALLTFGMWFAAGTQTRVRAQVRDPFAPNPAKKPRLPSAPGTPTVKTSGGVSTPEKKGPPPLAPIAVPPIEQRIEFYKRMRETAAINGEPLPKVTSVLILDEMSVTGIFKTPRGYAAMVEAKPINLSYTIYPGEKFFDGQLVAVEDNRLVFRKVTKLNNGKFVTGVENKALRQYSIQETVRGTAPAETSGKPETAGNAGESTAPAASPDANTPSPNAPLVISPVDELNRQPMEKPTETKDDKKNKKGGKRAKTAKNSPK